MAVPDPGRFEWFRRARFGMFIHWGLYAIPGRGEWVMNRELIPPEDYARLADEFMAEAYDPKAWARLAIEAGMRYVVLTTRHHDGFCLWDSKACEFNAVNSAAGRDLVAEYVEAVRSAGLKVGLYYSLGDWRNPDWRAGFQGDDRARERYVDYTHALVRELVTGYGPIDVLWYDFPQNYSALQWRSVALNHMVREHQPGILINNRALTTEDFATPEQRIRASRPGRLWESCLTLNRSWGYCAADQAWKSPASVASALASVSAGGGNLLLNVGPDGAGRIPEPAADILRRVGRWLETNGEAIYPGDRLEHWSWNLWGGATRSGHAVYLMLEKYWGGELVIGALGPRVLDAKLLASDAVLEVDQQGARTVIRGLPAEPPDPVLAVLRLDLDGPPVQDFTPHSGTADIGPDFPA